MEHHWHAFSFVHRITAAQPGKQLRGFFAIPEDADSFPLALAGEAVGQLAAWGAMAAVEFQRRPVAGIAGRIEFLSTVQPGEVLQLEADLETVDADAASYSGSASVNGKPVIRLTHCVGPMLPVAELDDPENVRDRFALLRGGGAQVCTFPGLPILRPERQVGDVSKSIRATLALPTEAPLFADHFPRRPVFPGSLLMQTKLDLVLAWLSELPCPGEGKSWKLAAVSGMKLRSFVSPGTHLDLEARWIEAGPQTAAAVIEARAGTRIVGAAQLELVAAQGT